MNRRLLLATGIAAIASPAFAQLEALPDDQRRLADQAAAYLQNLKTAKGRFVQTSSRGAMASGTLYLNRPGKARFEYDPPAQMLMVADGHNVSVYDRRLKTFDRYPLGATPLGIFLARRISLTDDVRVVRLTRTDNGFAITLADAHGQADGLLVLEFSQSPLALAGWTVVDQQGVQTHVRLTELTPTAGLDPALFTLADPRRTVD